MTLYTSLNDRAAAAQGRRCVLVIGNFDGIHRGHLALMDQGRRIAAASSLELGVLCFEPHPRLFFAPEKGFLILTPLALKSRLLHEAGADFVVAAPFDASMASQSPQYFAEETLIRQLRAAHLIVGENFRFGVAAGGDAALLAQIAERWGVRVRTVSLQLAENGQIFSSSTIRAALAAGDPGAAAAMLGREWEVSGKVVRGDERGRLIGFPTANLVPDAGEYSGAGSGAVPRYGVYAVRVSIWNDESETTGSLRNGVANWGVRPTFATPEPRWEVHMIDCNAGTLYDKRLRLVPIAFLRPEQKFSGIDALRAQIVTDLTKARLALSQYDETGTKTSDSPRHRISGTTP